jgi:Protein of unknown function (DUF3309)
VSLGTILLIIVVVALLEGSPGGGPFYGTGYYGGGCLGLIVVFAFGSGFNGATLNGSTLALAPSDRVYP